MKQERLTRARALMHFPKKSFTSFTFRANAHQNKEFASEGKGEGSEGNGRKVKENEAS